MQENEDKKEQETEPAPGETQGTELAEFVHDEGPEPEPEADPEDDYAWHREAPGIGEVVHYWSHEGQPPRPAMVTATSETTSTIKLTVFDDQGKTYAAEASVEGTGQGQWSYRY